MSRAQAQAAPSTQAAQTPPANPDPTFSGDPVASPDAPQVRLPQPSASLTNTDGTQVQKGQSGGYTLRAETFEVRLNASVIDAQGRVVDSLPEDAFQVYEDGVPQKITSFRHEDLPVSIGLLIDSSGSMYDKRPSVDHAALDLVQLSNPKDEEFLVDFNGDAYIDTDFTSSIAKLKEGLAYIKSAGSTAIYDAVIASADYLSKNAKQTKQVLVLVTDGEDDASSATLEQAIRRVQELDGPQIYTIGLLFGNDVDRHEARVARQVLTELAAQTGGQAYFPRSLKEVDPVAAEVAQDIRTQYTITYRSSNPPSKGGYRQIHVEAREKGYKGLEVRTRAGYFPHVSSAAAAQ